MIFSSITFIYYFLPVLLLVYFISPSKYKNLVLLFFSLLFYFLGEPKYIIILIISCIINYYISKLIEKNKHRKLYLIIGLTYNILQLLIFKYTDFFIANINTLFKTNLNYLYLVMPIGISFFTFQAISYIVDVYNKKHKSADNLITFMTYLCLFPQLIAGPIVRYSNVEEELKSRTHTFDKTSEGIKRFIIGLSKKVLLANVLGEFAKSIINETVVSSWLKPISFTLQIYFDFSGYSDMAIGLGLIFGFRFLENFNYPLIAQSITDFWRRWHISLSSWFRDYVYIPLGGNRVSKLKWIRNIFIVWFLTGFWHGDSWNFILWGLYFGVLLVLEKLLIGKYLEKTKIFKYLYTSIIIIISFLIFNSNNLNEIFISLKNMFFLNNIPFINNETIYYLKSYLIIFIVSILSATPLFKNIITKLSNTKLKNIINILEVISLILLLTITTAYLIDESFNPFLYFRF